MQKEEHLLYGRSAHLRHSSGCISIAFRPHPFRSACSRVPTKRSVFSAIKFLTFRIRFYSRSGAAPFYQEDMKGKDGKGRGRRRGMRGRAIEEGEGEGQGGRPTSSMNLFGSPKYLFVSLTISQIQGAPSLA